MLLLTISSHFCLFCRFLPGLAIIRHFFRPFGPTLEYTCLPFAVLQMCPRATPRCRLFGRSDFTSLHFIPVKVILTILTFHLSSSPGLKDSAILNTSCLCISNSTDIVTRCGCSQSFVIVCNFAKPPNVLGDPWRRRSKALGGGGTNCPRHVQIHMKSCGIGSLSIVSFSHFFVCCPPPQMHFCLQGCGTAGLRGRRARRPAPGPEDRKSHEDFGPLAGRSCGQRAREEVVDLCMSVSIRCFF